ncbi:hypothetical protein [Winogradskyella vidalii]
MTVNLEAKSATITLTSPDGVQTLQAALSKKISS